MFRVTLELLPEGDARRARVLGVCEVWNSGEGSPTHGHYVAQITERDRSSRRASIGLLSRRASMPWELVARALQALGYGGESS